MHVSGRVSLSQPRIPPHFPQSPVRTHAVSAASARLSPADLHRLHPPPSRRPPLASPRRPPPASPHRPPPPSHRRLCLPRPLTAASASPPSHRRLHAPRPPLCRLHAACASPALPSLPPPPRPLTATSTPRGLHAAASTLPPRPEASTPPPPRRLHAPRPPSSPDMCMVYEGAGIRRRCRLRRWHVAPLPAGSTRRPGPIPILIHRAMADPTQPPSNSSLRILLSKDRPPASSSSATESPKQHKINSNYRQGCYPVYSATFKGKR
ncbi:hypothetical protein GUJ93_ZPchr0008g13649 [Zizania palustris]|uniref:Uncharacterized protein n=1 Tax=Zizania palustris TaxID=103762 RepID=A0A8J5VIN3_ZIZPA|nr:hypothetical protein GUJ93_ZPchr0008g13649 [Zizania palustris]